jgi:hypothetical protein
VRKDLDKNTAANAPASGGFSAGCVGGDPLDGKLMAVAVKSGASLETGNPKLLFQTGLEGNPNLGQYAVTADGQRFLIMEPAREGAASAIEQFHIELNWFSELENKVAAKKIATWKRTFLKP